MINTIKYQYLTIIWAVLVLFLCLSPLDPRVTNEVPAFPGMDKLVHTAFFFVLTVLLFNGKIKQQHSYSFRISTVIKIFLVAASFGAGIELLQMLIFKYRSAESWDMFCNCVGVGMGVFSYVFLHRKGHEKIS